MRLDSKNSQTTSDLPTQWKLFGGSLLALSLSVPFLALGLVPAEYRPIEANWSEARVSATARADDRGDVLATTLRTVTRSHAQHGQTEDVPTDAELVMRGEGGMPDINKASAASLIAEGTIVPGEGIAHLTIGQRATSFADVLPPPTSIALQLFKEENHTLHRYDFGAFSLELISDVLTDKLGAISITAKNCADLMYFQTRQDGSPSLENGISIGSHISRVIGVYGEPVSGTPVAAIPGPVQQPLKQTHPGLELTYCPETMLVQKIAVVDMPDEPEMAEPLIAEAGRFVPSARATGDDVATHPSATATDAPFTPGAEPRLASVDAGGVVLPKLAPGATPPRHAVRPGRAGRKIEENVALGVPLYKSDTDPASILIAGARPRATGPLAAAIGNSLASEREESLRLSASDRRRAQIRLRLLGFSPNGIDGIFGPRTRVAISALQRDEELPVTGFLDQRTKDRLWDRSQLAYVDWRRNLRETKKKPEPSMARLPDGRPPQVCARDRNGAIIENQSFGCDVSVLRESVRSFFGTRG